MPIYEYECKQCHFAFERIQKTTDEPVIFCEQCGQNTVSRLVSAPGFQLKGTGWYVTDFKDKPKSPEKASNATTATSEAASGSSKRDAD